MLISIRFTLEKHQFMEFYQTLQALQNLWKKQKTLLHSHFYKDLESENTFCLMQEWTNREDMDAHLKSADFKVLAGAFRLLTNSHCVTASAPLQANEIEKIDRLYFDQN
jgi:quinol monooxygenase YgiN